MDLIPHNWEDGWPFLHTFANWAYVSYSTQKDVPKEEEKTEEELKAQEEAGKYPHPLFNNISFILQIMNIWSQIGMNQLIGLMIWDWKRRRLEVFTAMVLISLLQSNVKVSFQLFKDTIQLLK